VIIKLAVKNLQFSYHSKEVLKDFCLDIANGQIVSIVGPNGSGKSTLIKCIDRILNPSQGKILVDRRDVTKMSRMELARTIAYVPQNSLRVFPNTVFDVVLMGRRPHLGWKCAKRDEEIVWARLQLLGIENLALNPFTELSGGQQQKVLIARALAQDTGFILLDEPTSNLDIWHQLDVMEILRVLVKKQDLTAMIAIHDLNMAARYSDAIVMMKEGVIVAAGKPNAVITWENLEKVYGIRANVKFTEDILHIIPIARILPQPGRARPLMKTERHSYAES
jgi:iron complex transport system ATP-binding protein